VVIGPIPVSEEDLHRCFGTFDILMREHHLACVPFMFGKVMSVTLEPFEVFPVSKISKLGISKYACLMCSVTYFKTEGCVSSGFSAPAKRSAVRELLSSHAFIFDVKLVLAVVVPSVLFRVLALCIVWCCLQWCVSHRCVVFAGVPKL
jgi:hypothetical protein